MPCGRNGHLLYIRRFPDTADLYRECRNVDRNTGRRPLHGPYALEEGTLYGYQGSACPAGIHDDLLHLRFIHDSDCTEDTDSESDPLFYGLIIGSEHLSHSKFQSQAAVSRKKGPAEKNMAVRGPFDLLPAVYRTRGLGTFSHLSQVFPDHQLAGHAPDRAYHSAGSGIVAARCSRNMPAGPHKSLRDDGSMPGILPGDYSFYMMRCTSSTPSIAEMLSIVRWSSSTECTGKSIMHSTISSSV